MAVKGPLNPRAAPDHTPGDAHSASQDVLPNDTSAQVREVANGTEGRHPARRCRRGTAPTDHANKSDHRAALARHRHRCEVPLHDETRVVPPGGARPVAVHPSRSSPEIRSTGAPPLAREGGQVWLW